MLHFGCCFYLIIIIDIVYGASLLNCPKSKLKFEKILGVEPIFANTPILLYKNKDQLPITAECISRCHSNDDCNNFLLYYKNSSCYWYEQEGTEVGFIGNSDVAWFSKICLNDQNCTNLWYFERIPGATLVDNDTKVLPDVITRQQCEQYCLDEDEFICRSIKFKIKSDYENNNKTMGICILSNSDRHLSNSYRASNYNDEYLENQCSYPSSRQDFCSYDEFDKVILSHSDVYYERKTKSHCQQLCDSQKLFNCRGYSIVTSNQKCFLHSEDSRILGPKLLETNPHGQYFEKSRCINISVTCTDQSIKVVYLPSEAFYGKIYLNGESENDKCSSKGDGFNFVTLDISLLPNECGIKRISGPYNRTIWTGLLIVQYNALIQTQGDRIIKVGCLYQNDSKILVGTGLQISSMIPYTGTVEINSTFFSTSPSAIQMRVIDLQTQREVNDVEIGQDLQLVIEIEPYNGTFDVWVGHLIAMTEKNDESILLIDDRGCPVNKNIFPSFTNVAGNDSLELVATFKAFKFVSSPVVRFSAIVQFCADECSKRDCNARILNRLKRSTDDEKEVIKQGDNKEATIHMAPVELIILVRDPKLLSDRLVLENNKLLLAGYDFVAQEVCLDYSLFVGLIVVWVLLQIIFLIGGIVLIKRYRKRFEEEIKKRSKERMNSNFGLGYSNLQTKSRVHWADFD